MRAFLEVISGPYRGRVLQLETGETCKVGRSGEADYILADDGRLSAVHFALSCDDRGCHLFDWGAADGTYQNDVLVHKTVLANGDTVRAGLTDFAVYVVPDAARGDAGNEFGRDATSTPFDEMLRRLSGEPRALFALLDAARDPMVLEFLSDCGEQYQSLYEGEAAEELAEVAPYLVSLPPHSPLLEIIVRHGWGKSWGYYLTSAEPFEKVRRHFRSLQFVQDEKGDSLYFRFYDPRVMRVYLTSLEGQEVDRVFGPADAFFIESLLPTVMLSFQSGSHEAVPLTRTQAGEVRRAAFSTYL